MLALYICATIVSCSNESMYFVYILIAVNNTMNMCGKYHFDIISYNNSMLDALRNQ